MSCIVAGPVVAPHQQPPWPLVAAAGASGDDDGDDDPVFPAAQHPRSVHEADLEPINEEELMFACDPCRMAFAKVESVKAHHFNNPYIFFLRARFDPRRSSFILVESPTAVIWRRPPGVRARDAQP